MTKRFIPIFDGTDKRVVGAKDNGKIISFMDMFDLLNDLSEENEQLKMGINSLKLVVQNWEALDEEKDEQLDRQNRALKKLKKENEQLKSKNRGLQSELQIFKEDITHSNLQINKLADENEMIRNTINEMYKNERTQLGKSVLKQLLNNIEEIQ